MNTRNRSKIVILTLTIVGLTVGLLQINSDHSSATGITGKRSELESTLSGMPQQMANTSSALPSIINNRLSFSSKAPQSTPSGKQQCRIEIPHYDMYAGLHLIIASNGEPNIKKLSNSDDEREDIDLYEGYYSGPLAVNVTDHPFVSEATLEVIVNPVNVAKHTITGEITFSSEFGSKEGEVPHAGEGEYSFWLRNSNELQMAFFPSEGPIKWKYYNASGHKNLPGSAPEFYPPSLSFYCEDDSGCSGEAETEAGNISLKFPPGYYGAWTWCAYCTPAEGASFALPENVNKITATYEFEMACDPVPQCPGWDQVDFVDLDGNSIFEGGEDKDILVKNMGDESCTFGIDYKLDQSSVDDVLVEVAQPQPLPGPYTVEPGQEIFIARVEALFGRNYDEYTETMTWEMDFEKEGAKKTANLAIVDCSPKMNIVVKDSPAKMGEEYVRYEATLQMPSHGLTYGCREVGRENVSVSFRESSVEPDTTKRGDGLLNGVTRTKPLQDGETGVFSVITEHSWDWTGQKDKSCFDAALTGAAQDAVIGVFKSADQIDEIEKAATTAWWIDKGQPLADIIFASDFYDSATYDFRYALNIRGYFYPSFKMPGMLTVKVPVERKQAWLEYVGWRGYGEIIGAVPFRKPSLGWAGWIIEAGMQAAACAPYNYAVYRDSDAQKSAPNAVQDYDQPVELVPIHSATIDAQPESREKTIALLWLDASAYQVALKTSLARYTMAAQAEDSEWMSSHLKQAAEFNDGYVQRLKEIRSLTEEYIQDFAATGYVLTQEDLANLEQELINNGIPAEQRSILTELGFSNSEIDNYVTAKIGVVKEIPPEWEDLVLDLLNLNVENAEVVGEWLDEEAQSLPFGEIFMPLILTGYSSYPSFPGPDEQEPNDY